MGKECREYAKRVAAEIEAIYNGTTEVDTELHSVVCAWGGDRAEYPLDWDACDELESIIAEYMEMER